MSAGVLSRFGAGVIDQPVHRYLIKEWATAMWGTLWSRVLFERREKDDKNVVKNRISFSHEVKFNVNSTLYDLKIENNTYLSDKSNGLYVCLLSMGRSHETFGRTESSFR